jgi:DNA-directed RNA polymerase specialized sigma24 family protein
MPDHFVVPLQIRRKEESMAVSWDAIAAERDYLLRWARRWTVPEEAEDLVHEALLQAFEASQTFVPQEGAEQESMRAWLRTILYHRCCSLWRRQALGRICRLSDVVDDAVDPAVVAAEGGWQDPMDRLDALLDVVQALRALSPGLRQVVLQQWGVSSWPARSLACSDSVRALERARRSVRRLLQEGRRVR